MKKKIFTTLALVCLFIAGFAIATGLLTGKWTGTLKTPDGNEIPLTYVLKADSGKLTGTAATPEGEIPITDGKLVSSTDFTFNVSVNGADYKHTGKFYQDADSVGMDIDFNGQKLHTTLKRAK
jgi:cytochrome c biogenesis protein ResB